MLQRVLCGRRRDRPLGELILAQQLLPELLFVLRDLLLDLLPCLGGDPRNRLDGRAKVTGAARYAAEWPVDRGSAGDSHHLR